jgi:hypothetical protein
VVLPWAYCQTKERSYKYELPIFLHCLSLRKRKMYANRPLAHVHIAQTSRYLRRHFQSAHILGTLLFTFTMDVTPYTKTPGSGVFMPFTFTLNVTLASGILWDQEALRFVHQVICPLAH